ncbi:universal stress protein [Glaciecola sp. 2405UD65-10]|uniref:universal stress protein n=1 Tax=Glaciecola sp. 2405UD65-10 TaxID=3397244 RepID=UPI003B59E599
MSNYNHVLVAIDFDAEYEKVIQKALEVAPSPEHISLIYVILPSVYIQPYLYGMPTDLISDKERIVSAKARLEEVAGKFGLQVSNTHVECGDVADEIHNFANDKNVDLIVLGTHGRSGIKLLLGSTANAVLHGVKQDVLAVRMHD